VVEGGHVSPIVQDDAEPGTVVGVLSPEAEVGKSGRWTTTWTTAAASRSRAAMRICGECAWSDGRRRTSSSAADGVPRGEFGLPSIPHIVDPPPIGEEDIQQRFR